DGTTALGSGERVPKTSLRIAAYGTVDEANSALGLARIHLGQDVAATPNGGGTSKPDLARIDEMLLAIQNDLFDLGADLCVPDRGQKLEYEPLRMTEGQVKRLEAEIDWMNESLEPLRSFVLPGGTAAAAALHIARTISRRAERIMVELAQLPGEPVSDAALQYVNRLSDHLFVASRYVNDLGRRDVLWVPGKNR
ncbi:MAG: cob(I)yrinic acid a,c-diamide adenosyltransferase, partial [Hyphomicrobiaceae bacterium]|nr:cob(I)yrinic acid a,c-diamide adenosyltransferase [Hyphomicrobiaceae bacterium]